VSWLSEVRERVRSVLSRRSDAVGMDEEMRFHLEMEAERLAREEGLPPEEARRRAAVAFGGVDRYQEQVRDTSGLNWLTGMSLDFRLGFRMLAKYPGLTLVGGVAIAFAVATGAATFQFLRQIAYPAIPLPAGERIVGIRTWNAASNRSERRVAHDVALWRRELRSLSDVGAWEETRRSLILRAGGGDPVYVASMSASGFRVAGVAPLLGRTLQDADEQVGAAPVLVIGHDEWRRRFGGDPHVLGRLVRLGSTGFTVVGVMPREFAFPAAHGYWTALPLAALDAAPERGPRLRVFARLAPGASLSDAQAEMAVLARRWRVERKETHARLDSDVVPYGQSFLDPQMTAGKLMSLNVFLLGLLVLVFGNVALLVFARAASREGEVVVRNALGASRRRIVTQMLAEALVLGSLAGAAGVAAAAFALRWGLRVAKYEDGRLPFWYGERLTPATLLYAALLTLLCAAISGVLPALKVTRGIESRLRQASAGGGGLQFGGVWTLVIVLQVAVTVAFPVTAFFMRRDAEQIRALNVGFPAREYLSARVDLGHAALGDAPPDTSAAARLRLQAVSAELKRRLEADPAVLGVAFTDLLPAMDHEQRRVEVEGGIPISPDSASRQRVSSATIAPGYFQALGARVLAGRDFGSGDAASAGRTVIVNQSFARQLLGGRRPVGHRVRYLDPPSPDEAPAHPQPGPWMEIVGVVKDLGMTDGSDPQESGAGMYLAALPGAAVPVYTAVHLRGDPESFAPRLRSLATAADPELRVDEVVRLDGVQDANLKTIAFWFRALVGVSAVAMLLSLAGIYAVMAFAVSRRTREIGIRVALGADPRRVVAATFARPLAQVSAGVAAGTAVVAWLVYTVIGTLSLREISLVAAYAALMLGVCMLACIVPTRRALRVEPTDALRADA
jgi:putative ABC transport system permease protein